MNKTEEFILKAKKIHGDKYDYSKFKYDKHNVKGIIICPIHGEFEQTPNSHLSGHGCSKCGRIKIGQKKALNKDTFIEKAKAIHGDKYDYSKVEYINNRTKVEIVCSIHGSFYQTPSNHLKGQGCPKCAHEYVNSLKVLSNEEFIKRAIKKHGNRYLYDKTNYESFDKDVIVTCPEHGDFLVNAHQHISNGTGCPKCCNDGRRKRRLLTTSEFIQKAKEIHEDKYNYSKVEYKTSKTPVIIICPKHGEFLQMPNKHLSGHGCQKCKQTHGEEIIFNILKKLNVNFTSEFICKTKERSFRIDFAVKLNDKTYFIEYNGEQHYRPVDIFGGEEAFSKQIERDLALRNYCKQNNIKLLEIKYNIKKENIENLIKKFINAPNISDNISKSGELLENPKQMDNQQPN